MQQPDPRRLVESLGLSEPLIGFYDAPEPEPFAPLAEPGLSERGACVFDFRPRWLRGEMLHLTPQNHGCRGAGRALCGVQAMEREAFITFLRDQEGLRASRDLMGAWIDANGPYRRQHDHLLIGPLRPRQYRYLKTVTFYVNPDQLSVLLHGAYYHARPDEPPVVAPFGSSCMELVTVFAELDTPRAVIGSTDMAMRDRLPADLLAFTVTRPMFESLCSLDEQSFLGKAFLRALRDARGGDLGRRHPGAGPAAQPDA